MIRPNICPVTGARYGVLSGRTRTGYEALQWVWNNGENLTYRYWARYTLDALNDLFLEYQDGDMTKGEVARQLSRRGAADRHLPDILDALDCGVQAATQEAFTSIQEGYEDNEETYWYQDNEQGLVLQLSYLGGAALLTIMASPWVVRAQPCSPCCPNAGDLDSLDPEGVETFCLPPDWVQEEDAATWAKADPRLLEPELQEELRAHWRSSI